MLSLSLVSTNGETLRKTAGGRAIHSPHRNPVGAFLVALQSLVSRATLGDILRLDLLALSIVREEY